MFDSRSPHRPSAKIKRSPFTRRLSRQFGVEAMEGRLMLAASGLDVTPVELQPAPFVALQNLIDSQVTLENGEASIPVEGGKVTFILSSDFSLDSIYANRAAIQIRQELIDVVNAWRQNNEGLYNGLPGISLDGAGGDVFTFGIDSNTSILSDADFDDASGNSVGGSWIRAVNFQDMSGASGLNSSLGSFEFLVVPESRFAMNSNAEEGGPIPIKAIFSNSELELVQEVEPTHRAPAVASHLTSEQYPVAALALTSTGEASISGEWARAMVLETAGGEPDAMAKSPSGKANQKSDAQPSSRNGGPLSYMTPVSPTGPVSTRAADDSGALPVNSANLQPLAGVGYSHVPMPSGTALHAGNLAYSLVSNQASRADMSFAAERAARATQLVEASAGMPRAFEAAFDELGDDSLPDSDSLGTDWLSRSLGAAPLLMVLALERVASRNSRRNRRDAAPVDIRRPKLARPVANV